MVLILGKHCKGETKLMSMAAPAVAVVELDIHIVQTMKMLKNPNIPHEKRDTAMLQF